MVRIMADKEISVEKQLENCNGNLKIIRICNSSIKIEQEPVIKSKGDSADSLNDSSHTAVELKKSFDNLLNCSISFFENVGRRFDDADEQAARSIEDN